MTDQRLGAILRAVRVRRGLTQEELGREAGASRSVVSLAERGHIGTLSVNTVRRIFGAVDIRVDLVGRWRGGDLDRLLNARHSGLADAVMRLFTRHPGWIVIPEVTFSFYGERGSIDLLAWHAASRSLLVIELKTELVDVNDLLSTLDRKARLAMRIAHERGLPTPAHVSRWVIVVDGRTNRRHVAVHHAVLSAALPHDGRHMRAWLRQPSEAVSALSFMPDSDPRSVRRSLRSIRRVKRARRPAA